MDRDEIGQRLANMALKIQSLSVQAINDTKCPWWAGLVDNVRDTSNQLQELSDEIEESISE